MGGAFGEALPVLLAYCLFLFSILLFFGPTDCTNYIDCGVVRVGTAWEEIISFDEENQAL